jgi:hypothetical protein
MLGVRNQRAQLSLDLLLVSIVFLVFVQSLVMLADGINSAQRRASIENQEIIVAREIASMVSASAAFGDADSFGISFVAPKVYSFGAEQECTITIGDGKLVVSVGKDTEKIEKTIDFVAPSATGIVFPSQLKCGEAFEIKKVQG